MRLSNIRKLGRYEDTTTGKQINVFKGTKKGYGTDHYFYLYRGKRVIITQAEFHSKKYKKIETLSNKIPLIDL